MKNVFGQAKVFLANAVSIGHLAVIVTFLVALILVVSCNKDSAINKAQKQANAAVDIVSTVATDVTDIAGNMTACTESLEGRVAKLEDTEVPVTDQKLQRQLTALKARQDERVKKENAEYIEMMAYIQRVNPSFALCSKSDAEIRTLLTNGQWDVESKIKLEYDRLVAEAANQALVAAEVSLSAVATIAKEPESSVGQKTKQSISAQVAAYYEEYGDK